MPTKRNTPPAKRGPCANGIALETIAAADTECRPVPRPYRSGGSCPPNIARVAGYGASSLDSATSARSLFQPSSSPCGCGPSPDGDPVLQRHLDDSLVEALSYKVVSETNMSSEI